MKVLFIQHHPAPYRDPVLLKLKQENIEFDVVNLYETDSGHAEWNYCMSEDKVKCIRLPFIGDLHYGLLKLIHRYDVIYIPGWYPLFMLFFLRVCILLRKKVIFSCDTIRKKHDLKHKYIYQLVKQCHAFYVPGNMTERFLVESLGVDKSRVFQGSYMLDETFWSNAVKQRNVDSIRNKMGIGNNFDGYIELRYEKMGGVVLFVGNFVKNRNIPLLLNAFSNVLKNNPCLRLIIIGSGTCYMDIIKKFKEEHPLNFIHLEKVSFYDLADYYAIADCYVHPGKEPYSLATVQAVLSGIPVIANSEVGCVLDYIEDGNNGMIVESDENQLTLAIQKVFEDYVFYKKKAETLAKYYLINRNVDFAVTQLKRCIYKALQG